MTWGTGTSETKERRRDQQCTLFGRSAEWQSSRLISDWSGARWRLECQTGAGQGDRQLAKKWQSKVGRDHASGMREINALKGRVCLVRPHWLWPPTLTSTRKVSAAVREGALKTRLVAVRGGRDVSDAGAPPSRDSQTGPARWQQP